MEFFMEIYFDDKKNFQASFSSDASQAGYFIYLFFFLQRGQKDPHWSSPTK